MYIRVPGSFVKREFPRSPVNELEIINWRENPQRASCSAGTRAGIGCADPANEPRTGRLHASVLERTVAKRSRSSQITPLFLHRKAREIRNMLLVTFQGFVSFLLVDFGDYPGCLPISFARRPKN